MNAHCADARTEEYLSGIAALVVIPVLCENIFPASAFSPADLSLSLSAESSVYGLLTSWASAPAQQTGKNPVKYAFYKIKMEIILAIRKTL